MLFYKKYLISVLKGAEKEKADTDATVPAFSKGVSEGVI